MKITKSYLKQLIKEEVQKINEEPTPSGFYGYAIFLVDTSDVVNTTLKFVDFVDQDVGDAEAKQIADKVANDSDFYAIVVKIDRKDVIHKSGD